MRARVLVDVRIDRECIWLSQGYLGMLLKIKSFGPWLLANCTIPIPKLARAIGVHLHTLENAMHDNSPTQEMLERIVLVSEADYYYRTPRLTVEAMMRQIASYDATAKDMRETTTIRDWEETPPVLKPVVGENIGTQDYASWAQSRTAFTWTVYRTAFPYTNKEMAEVNLATIRFKSNQEFIGERPYHIYRWNPLDLARPRGKPLESKLVPRKTTPMAEWATQNKRSKAEELLAGMDIVRFDEFLVQMRIRLNIEKPIRSESAKQTFRKLLASLGWAYNQQHKVWVRPGLVL